MAMRMANLKTAINLLGNLKTTRVGVLYLDIHTSAGIYLSNVSIPIVNVFKVNIAFQGTTQTRILKFTFALSYLYTISKVDEDCWDLAPLGVKENAVN
jgi:hypothetical protein